MKIRFCLFIAFLFSISVNGFAQKINKIPSEKPRLIIGIVVDQMRYDYISMFWDNFEEGGFKRLINEGTLCSYASYNNFYNQQGVGEATIATGANPSGHGIVSEFWYLRLKNKEVHCIDDDRYKTIGSDSDKGRKSPQYLNSSTFSDELKLSNNFKSKVFGVGLDPSSAILSAGHTANCAYWFDENTANWISSSYYIDSLPGWVREFNKKRLPETYLQRQWNLSLPIEQYKTSLPDKNKYESGIEKQTAFPYEISDFAGLKKKNPNYKILKTTPFGNLLTKDFAISLIVNEELGKDDYTDIITIGFNSTEYIGKSFGPKSLEVQDAFIRLDKELSHFLKFIDDYIGKENVLIYLTSNHGVSDVPAYLTDSKIPAGYFDSQGAISLLRSYLNVVYGKGKWIQYYNKQQLFLDHNLIEDSKIDLKDMQTKVAQFLIQFSGISNTITSNTLETTDFTQGVFQKMQNSYNQQQSGDIMINLKPGWIEKSDYCTDSNSPYLYDTHVPLILYGWKVGHGVITSPVEMIDIAPTISMFLEISFPNSCSGKPVKELLK